MRSLFTLLVILFASCKVHKPITEKSVSSFFIRGGNVFPIQEKCLVYMIRMDDGKDCLILKWPEKKVRLQFKIGGYVDKRLDGKKLLITNFLTRVEDNRIMMLTSVVEDELLMAIKISDGTDVIYINILQEYFI